MSERVCEGCRFYAPFEGRAYGECRRKPPVGSDGTFAQSNQLDWCGEWRDKTITPEQEERRELIRRFAVALMSTEWGGDLSGERIWQIAASMADAEPNSSEIPNS